MPLSTTFAAASIKGYGGGTPSTYYGNLSSGTLYSSALAHKNATGAQQDGIYWLNLPTVGVRAVPCLMNDSWNPGGWMMLMKATRGTTFNYNSSHWTTSTTLNNLWPVTGTGVDGDAKYDTFNVSTISDLMARWPDVQVLGGSLSYGGCWVWKQNITGLGYNNALSLFTNGGSYNDLGDGNGKFGGLFVTNATSYAGYNNAAAGPTIWSSQSDINFYGFNFVNYKAYGLNANCRWGFGWNENGEGNYSGDPNLLTTGGAPGSDDVSGGLGMDSNYGSYSAGDCISCCQNRTGYNRSMRVEMYGR